MLNTQSWLTIRTATLLALTSWLVPACGGTAEFGAGEAGASNSAGASGSGSASGSGAGGAGNASGSTSAGASGSGASGGVSCADVACLAIGCGEGYKPVLLPGNCCSTCVPDGSGGAGGGNSCELVDCSPLDCAQGYKYQAMPGMCCGTRVPDPQACSNGQAEYKKRRDAFLSNRQLLSCVKAADCRYLATNAYCGDACPTQPVNAAAAAAVEQQLSEFAANNCSSCTPLQPPCAAPLPPACLDGQCSFGVFY